MRLARRSSQSRAKIHREAFLLQVSGWGVLALLLLTPSAGQADCEYFRPYPKDYNTCLEREKAERATQQREWLYRQTQRRQQEQLRQQQQQKQEALEREQQKEAEERAFRQRQLDLMSQQMEQQRAYQQRQLEMQQQQLQQRQLQQQHDLNCNVFGYGNRSYSIRCN